MPTGSKKILIPMKSATGVVRKLEELLLLALPVIGWHPDMTIEEACGELTRKTDVTIRSLEQPAGRGPMTALCAGPS